MTDSVPTIEIGTVMPAQETVRSFTIITTISNELCALVHNRMPVILPPETWTEVRVRTFSQCLGRCGPLWGNTKMLQPEKLLSAPPQPMY